MRALNFRAPFADFVASGLKRWEWRTWSTKYRGPVAIVQSGLGVVGIAELVEVVPHGDELFAWKFINARRVVPVPMKGKLNLWHIPPGTQFEFLPLPYRGKVGTCSYTIGANGSIAFESPPHDQLARYYIAHCVEGIAEGTLEAFHLDSHEL